MKESTRRVSQGVGRSRTAQGQQRNTMPQQAGSARPRTEECESLL